ncbi:transposable element Tcb1 transposase [Trichonephila clavipes]|nr:transposable element Tcb1 transposase [Trichonephila clavipes]
MALEYPLDRRRTLSFGRFGEYSQLPNLRNIQSTFHLTSSATLTKSNGVVSVFRVFYSWPVFFKELGAGGPVTCSITKQRYASLLRNKIIPELQARQCLSRIIFMQDGAPTHITRCRKDSGLTGYCGLSFRKIGSRVGRNQTVMRICDRRMQESTTDRRGRSHPPQCTTSREDRKIVRMAVTDRSVTSRTVAQHIESVTHHSVSARTIRRRLQQSGLSARRPLLGLPLTQNHRRLRRQWCDERM